MTGKIHYGIKFPFTAVNDEGLFIDLNNTIHEKAISDIMHIILTEKGTMIRRPEFGTNLLKYIFEPNDSAVWEDIKDEVINTVTKYLANIKLNDFSVTTDVNDDNKIILSLDYSVKMGNIYENNKADIEI